MSGRHIVAAVLGIALSAPGAFAGQPPARHRPGSVNHREHRQNRRIKNGVKNDEITKREADRLKGDEAAVRAEEKVYRKSGDGLNKAERKDLEKDLNKTSREIYRAKHNQRKPKPPEPTAQN
jgi:hypothetical protein